MIDRNIQADEAFLEWMGAMSKNVVHIADAWYAAVKWADSHPHWIPVEDELPPKKDKYSKCSAEVLVITERKECFIAKYWYDGDNWAVSGFTTSKLTHWMPIVPPRKEDKE